MTTEELIKKLKENKRVDVVVITALDGVKKLIILNDMSNPLFRLPTTATNWFELESVHSQLIADSLGKDGREYVAAQINEYLSTSLDERNPEKKYRLVWQFSQDDPEPWILGYAKIFGNWDINDEDWLNGKGYQTRFTDADLKKIADGDRDMLDRLNALKKEVKDNAC